MTLKWVLMSDPVLLGDVASVVDCEHKTAPVCEPGNEFAFSVGTRALRGGGIDFSQAKHVDEETYRGWSRRAELRRGDVILAREAPIGGVGWVSGEPRICLGQRTVLVRALPESVDGRFLFYLLQSPQPQEWMHAHGEGSTVKHLNVSDVRRIRLDFFPPLDVQRRIAGVLAALDGLIDTDKRLAGILDEESRLVGRRFITQVSTEPLVPMGEIAQINKGYSYKSAELTHGTQWLVNLKNVGRDGTFQERGFKPLSGSPKQQHLIDQGDVVVAQTDLTQAREVIARPVRVRRMGLEGQLVASLDLVSVKPLPGDYITPEYIFAVLDQQAFRDHALGYCNGTTVLHMGAKAIPEFVAPRPTPQQVGRLTESVRPLRAAADALLDEASQLSAARDELLPLLLAGRVVPGEVEV